MGLVVVGSCLAMMVACSSDSISSVNGGGGCVLSSSFILFSFLRGVVFKVN